MFTGGAKHAIFNKRHDDDDDEDEDGATVPAQPVRTMTMPARTGKKLVPNKGIVEVAERKHGIACSNYQLDMTAARFGDCKCGFPKMDHVRTGGVSTADHVSASTANSQSKFAPTPAREPNRVTGPTSKVVQRAVTAPVIQPEFTADVSSNNDAGGACDNYELDMTAARFGDCKCGFPKRDHVGKPSVTAAISGRSSAHVTLPAPSPQPSAPAPPSFKGFHAVSMGSVHDRTKTFGSPASAPKAKASDAAA